MRKVYTILLTVVLVVVPALVALGWQTMQSAFAACVDGRVIITVSFTNTDNKAMDVVATDEQTGLSVDLGSVAAGTSTSGEIDTGLSSVGDGQVMFDLTWTDGKKGSDAFYASYTGAECEEPPPPVELVFEFVTEDVCAPAVRTFTLIVPNDPAVTGYSAIFDDGGDGIGRDLEPGVNITFDTGIALDGSVFLNVAVSDAQGNLVFTDTATSNALPAEECEEPEPPTTTTTQPDVDDTTTTVAPTTTTTGAPPKSAPEGGGLGLLSTLLTGGLALGTAAGGVTVLVRRRRES